MLYFSNIHINIYILSICIFLFGFAYSQDKKLNNLIDSLKKNKTITKKLTKDTLNPKGIDTTKIDTLKKIDKLNLNKAKINDTSANLNKKPKGIDTTKIDTLKKIDKLNLNKAKINDTSANLNKPKVYRYLYINSDFINIDTVDTTFSIKSYYSFNYLRKDNFGKIRINNIGQGYNSLTYDEQPSIYPQIGMPMKFISYVKEEDIMYYDVEDPFTELFYISGMEEGQAGSGLLSFKLADSTNFTFSYNGLNSLGNYRNSKSNQGTLITSFNSRLSKYSIFAHFIYQDFFNQENGGIKHRDQFEKGNQKYFKRSMLDVNMDEAESFFRAKRFYANQFFDVINKNSNKGDSIISLKIAYKISMEKQYYTFKENNPSKYFGDVISTDNSNDSNNSNIIYKDSVNRRVIENEFRVITSIRDGFKLDLAFSNLDLKYSVKDIKKINLGLNYFSANMYMIDRHLGSINIKSSYKIPDDTFKDNYLLDLSLNTKLYDFPLSLSACLSAKPPYLSYMHYSSYYKKINWDKSLNSQKIKKLNLSVSYDGLSKYITKTLLSLKYFNLDDFVYIDNDMKLNQYDKSVQFAIMDFNIKNKFWNLTLDNRVLYQHILSGQSVFRMPNWVIRSALVYSDDIFDKALYYDIGIDFNYFSSFISNDNLSVINSPYLGSGRYIGNYSVFNLLVNLKIKTMKIFFMLDHWNSYFSELNYYSIPSHPYTDILFRIGVIWNFFS